MRDAADTDAGVIALHIQIELQTEIEFHGGGCDRRPGDDGLTRDDGVRQA